MYYVQGGVFEDTSFTHVIAGTYEVYGPYSSYEDAKKKWWEKTCVNVDDCHHKLNIIREDNLSPLVRK